MPLVTVVGHIAAWHRLSEEHDSCLECSKQAKQPIIFLSLLTWAEKSHHMCTSPAAKPSLSTREDAAVSATRERLVAFALSSCNLLWCVFLWGRWCRWKTDRLAQSARLKRARLTKKTLAGVNGMYQPNQDLSRPASGPRGWQQAYMPGPVLRRVAITVS